MSLAEDCVASKGFLCCFPRIHEVHFEESNVDSTIGCLERVDLPACTNRRCQRFSGVHRRGWRQLGDDDPFGGVADKSSEESRIMIGSGDMIVLLLFSEEFSPSLDDDEF